MELFEYKKVLPDSYWRARGVYIDEYSDIADGVMLGANVCIDNSSIGSGSVIEWNSVINNSVIGELVRVRSSVVEDSTIGTSVTIGPFARIRDRARVGDGVRVGNFVEIKKSVVGAGCKVAHLAYIGDATLGDDCNVGCGVIFCNYNGAVKSQTKVGNNVFIGSNVNLIAPISIADNAYIAAGSTVTDDVEEGDFVIARSRQVAKQNFKNPYLNRKKYKK